MPLKPPLACFIFFFTLFVSVTMSVSVFFSVYVFIISFTISLSFSFSLSISLYVYMCSSPPLTHLPPHSDEDLIKYGWEEDVWVNGPHLSLPHVFPLSLSFSPLNPSSLGLSSGVFTRAFTFDEVRLITPFAVSRRQVVQRTYIPAHVGLADMGRSPTAAAHRPCPTHQGKFD